MSLLPKLVAHGGPVMYVIILLSILLYTQCAKLLLSLYLARRSTRITGHVSRDRIQLLETKHEELAADFRNRRLTMTSMIAAAPLLGLLGTVSGMSRTFEALSSETGQRSMADLAAGISEVLVATESGLAVAIPALLVVYLAHREIDKQHLRLNKLRDHDWKNGSR